MKIYSIFFSEIFFALRRSVILICIFGKKEKRTVWCQFHQHFTQKFCAKLFLYSHLRLELFLAQEYWRKCAHKMLVKLTSGGVNR
jgi:hypothetical protein